MTYEEGAQYMIDRCKALKESRALVDSFEVGNLRITYPGKKVPGDYRLSVNDRVIRHDEVVQSLYKKTTAANANELIDALEDLYVHGLRSENPCLPQPVKALIYWITLQEDINYPPASGYYGKKLSFQRFYEAILAKLGFLPIEEVVTRTNKHGGPPPPLLRIADRKHPVFYE
ncbi:MAG TPA: hypothetical protein VNQ55_09825 [Parapedobacter sp.]|nr:hypothetical protein [Parapedobacter sp.]